MNDVTPAAPPDAAPPWGAPAGKAEKIVRTCLYEGYLLWPYRRSALKNTKRWTFGGVFPQTCATALGEPYRMRTQVLLDTSGRPAGRTRVSVRVRFLHVVDRGLERAGPDGPEAVDELTVDGERHLAWQEATEREVSVPLVLAAALPGPVRAAVDVPAGTDREPLRDGAGRPAGAVVRRWRALRGTVEITAEPVRADEPAAAAGADDPDEAGAAGAAGVYRLTVDIVNTTPCPVPDADARGAREEACSYAFVSTHTVLHSDTGYFVSLVDPPRRLREAAGACGNQGTWPVLVDDETAGGDGGAPPEAGEEADGGGSSARTVLSSPVTLYDFPEVAPESPGDLFDGTEIDRLLILGVMSLTEEEQREARACDPRAREILDRCAGLGPEELLALHGTIREFRPVREDA
ncbi:hypothetical protein CUT44_01950 [Streptomyces carminius]|uniref:Hydrogenase maturation protease n=1 Tax=Streptomyces carminius TaxID=2665496 RepID=A0A2M8MC97_9ACTN|nr:hypothetical protein [Streptomyces carminius]PJE98029.1 hypothetical protein CUT44_10210 [Streptomyces carminius]PJF01855.1 hypothetical protein CUT44_01950 [Streptomyces carminius]